MSAYAETRFNTKVITNDRGNYWRYYGLQRDPFMPIVEDIGYFLPQRWEQYFDLLHYLCESNNVLLSVTGVKGSGKTTFMRQFLAQVIESTHICRLVGSSMLTSEQLRNTLIKDFGLTTPSGETIEEQLENLLLSMQTSKKPYLLVIDDAHRLLPETLRNIFNLIKHQSEYQMRFHVLLVGELQLETMLAVLTTDADKRLIHSVNLESFTLADTEAYIKHRLVAAGLPGAVPTTAGENARIFKLSEGIPGRINAVARQVLIDGMQQRHFYNVSSIIRARRTQFLGSSVILIMLLIIAFMLTHNNLDPTIKLYHLLMGQHDSTTNVVTNATDKKVAIPTAIVNQASENNTTQNSNIAATTNNTTQTQPAITAAAAPVTAPTSTTTAAETPKTSTTDMPKIGLNHGTTKQWFAVPLVKFTPNKTNTTPVEIEKTPTGAATNQNTTAIKSINNTGSTVVTIPTTPHSIMTTTKPVITKTAKTNAIAAITPAAINKTSNTSHAPAILLTPTSSEISTGSHYTLQLIGVSNEAAIDKFITKNQLGGQAYYYRTKYRDKDWYVIIYGNYATRQQAEQALQALPETVRNQHPWARTMADVQQSVNRYYQTPGAAAITTTTAAPIATPAAAKPITKPIAKKTTPTTIKNTQTNTQPQQEVTIPNTLQ